MTVYIAGPLFIDAERAFNLRLADALACAGDRVYLPQRDTPEPPGVGRTRTIFDANLCAIQGADVIVAVCDGLQVDDGTPWEVGYAVAWDIPVVGLRTDSRSRSRTSGSI